MSSPACTTNDRDNEPTQQIPIESLADCAAYHRQQLATRGLVARAETVELEQAVAS